MNRLSKNKFFHENKKEWDLFSFLPFVVFTGLFLLFLSEAPFLTSLAGALFFTPPSVIFSAFILGVILIFWDWTKEIIKILRKFRGSPLSNLRRKINL